MAATLTPDGELTYFSFPIEKHEETGTVNPVDGTPDLIVYGKATDGTLDSDLQTVDPEWSGKALQEWLDTGGNVRVQHQARRDPAGVGLSVDLTVDGHYAKALVTEPVAKHLVRTKALKDFSVGISMPDIRPDPTGKAVNGVITGRRDGTTKISELSLVDRGSNFNSRFQLVKAAGDGTPEFVGKMLTDVEVHGSVVTEDDLNRVMVAQHDMLGKTIAAANAVSTSSMDVSVTLPDDVSVSFKPSDLAKLVKHRELAEKRQMDPNVGGGVDRDQLSAGDFAGPDRSFPIVTPGDVSDAASSLGRTKHDPAQVKRRIISIAHRKGPSFVAQLPDSWTSGDSSKETGVADVTKEEVVETAPVDGVEKGGSVCLGCGDNLKSGNKFCSGCGKANPGAKTKAVEPDETEVAVPDEVKDGTPPPPSNEDGDDGGDTPSGDDTNPTDSPNDGDGGSKKMPPSFGKKGKGKKGKPPKAMKAASPADGITDAADTAPAPAHREPDGTVVATFERDAGLPSDTAGDAAHDSPGYAAPKASAYPERDALMRLKTVGVPVDLGKLHDLTCPAFHPDDVAKSYPSDSLTALDVNHWQQRAFDQAAAAPIEKAQQATALWQNVVTLKNVDPQVVLELRSESYKAFQDANPGPGSAPTPTELSPSRFNRPLITAGHAAASPGQGAPNSATVPTGQFAASQFGRGYESAGRAADSPGNSGGSPAPMPAPATTGVPGRTFYTNALRDNARQAMNAMHDHIAQTFPDICPMHAGGSPYGDGSLPTARPVPVGVGSPAPHGAPGVGKAVTPERALKKARRRLEKAALAGELSLADYRTRLEELTTEKAVEPEVAVTVEKTVTAPEPVDVTAVITKAVADAIAERDTELAELRKQLKKTNKTLDTLASQPETGAPYRGPGLDLATKNAAPPEALPQLPSRAERAQHQLYNALHDQWRHDPDPMQREVAWAELTKMTGLAGQYTVTK